MQKNTEQMKLENDQIEVIVNYHGAELRSLKKKATDQEYLWNADAKYWGRTSPVLFPFVGGVKNKVYRYEGKEYPMNQHGFAREKEFTCVEEGTEKLRYRLMSDEETRKYYPFDFVLWITYELREKEVLVSWEVENRSGEVMSFTIGGHPGFRFEKEGEQKEDYELYFPENTEFTATAVDLVNGTGKPDQKYRVKLTDHTLVLSDQLFDVDTLVVDDAQIREVWLRRKATGQLYAGVRCIDEFCSFGIWSLPKGPYVCLEPWAGRCDDEGFCEDISKKPGINRAKPGECWKKQYAILIG